MREFQDERGQTWVASIGERPGDDYKGRHFLILTPGEVAEGEAIPLDDVRWNSPTTAERTLRTMSLTELRRRLRWAKGRASVET